MLNQLIASLDTVFSMQALFFIFGGALLGVIAGAMPGFSSAGAVAIILPFTYGMDATMSIILLTAVYSGATYGGSITATLLNTPGTPESAVMTFDGYALTKKGKAGKALWAALFAGTIGGLIGTVVLIIASVPLAKEALNFGPPEYFALALLGLTVLAMLTEGSVVKGLIVCIFGLMIAVVGMDPITGVQRMTFGSTMLLEGVKFIPALIGLFAVSEAFDLIRQRKKNENAPKVGLWSSMLSRKEFKGLIRFILVGTGIGMFVGIKPGGGATIASIISYSAAKQISPNRENFGKGQLEGLATPEAADKATVGAALIPMLTLGIPASATTAVLIGAFTLHGIQPGPNLFSEHANLVYSVFDSLIFSNLAVFIIGLIGIPFITRISIVPKPILGIVILILTLLGAYASETNMMGMWVAIVFGIIGYIMKRYKFPVAPIVLGLVLGPLLEGNFRQSLLLSRGDLSIFVDRPISLVLLIVCVLFVAMPIYWNVRDKRRKQSIVKKNKENSSVIV